jgi:hypothetical protein
LFSLYSYEPIQAKIERHFQKQNVIREDPQAYTNRFGDQLCEPTVAIEQARAAGVLEDLVNRSCCFLLNEFYVIF